MALTLLARGYHVIGTCQANRVEMPKEEMKAAKAALKERGDHVYWCDNKTGLRVVIWQDSSVVTLLATCYSCTGTYVSRKGKAASSTKRSIAAPEIIPIYNSKMQGVNRIDHLNG